MTGLGRPETYRLQEALLGQQQLWQQQQQLGGIQVPPDVMLKEEEEVAKPFTDDELDKGIAEELRRVVAPRPGETVEVGYVVTDLVLCLNRAIEEIQELKLRLEVAEARAKSPAKAEELLELPRIGSEYDEDLDS
jgi:hypothetical protein